MNLAIITTHFHPNQKVSFTTPDAGYSLEDLDTLEAAIKHARRKLTEEPLEVIPKADADAACKRRSKTVAPGGSLVGGVKT